MALRKVIKISVTPAAKTIIEGFAKKHDMTEIGIASRVYEWFSRQDDVVRKGILDMLPDGYQVDVAELALRRIVKDVKGGKKSAD